LRRTRRRVLRCGSRRCGSGLLRRRQWCRSSRGSRRSSWRGGFCRGQCAWRSRRRLWCGWLRNRRSRSRLRSNRCCRNRFRSYRRRSWRSHSRNGRRRCVRRRRRCWSVNRGLCRCRRRMRCLWRMRVHSCRRPSLCSLGRRFLGFAISFGGCLSIGDTLQMMTNLFSNFDGDRAGMSFLLGYAETRQKVNNGLGLHLEFTGEFINADLGCVTHTA
jgi:hypothetical protein